MAAAKRLFAISVEPADHDTVRKLADQIRPQLPRPWLWATTEAEADVLVIDVDSVYGHMDWLRAHGQGRPVLCLSAHQGGENDVTLVRPFTAQGLLAALKRFDSDGAPAAVERSPAPAPEATSAPPTPAPAAAAAPAPTPAPAPAPTPAPAPAPAPVARPAAAAPAPAPAAPAPAPAPAPAAALPSELGLADYCTPEALPAPHRIEREGAVPLVVDAGSDCYYGGTTLKPLAPYCLGTIKRSEWKPVVASELAQLRGAAGGAQPLSRLIWLYTLLNSHGHLLAGLDINARFKLTRWPQIEREFPKHFRIATVMMKGPATLTEIVDQSGASLSDVVDFVNAYSVIGVAEAETPAAAPAPASSEGAGGLLARLRGRTRGA